MALPRVTPTKRRVDPGRVRAGRARSDQKRPARLPRQFFHALENERRRIARDLHDQAGQTLTALKFLLEGVPTAGRFEPAELAEIRELVHKLMTLVNGLALDLRPAALDHLGLLPALRGDLERFAARTRIQVDLACAGLERRFSPEVETAAFRIVQEAVTNVVRHSTVSRATVRLSADKHSLSLEVADQGAGFDAKRVLRRGSTAGLPGMQERVRALGGSLRIESSPGAGTCILVELPL